MKQRLVSLVIALLLALASVFAVTPRQAEFYPLIEIEAPSSATTSDHASPNDALTLTFLFSAHPSLKSCEALTGNIARVSLAKCKTCIVRQIQCIQTLNAKQQAILSEQPLDTASGHMTTGVLVYWSANPEVSLAACQETQRQSVAGEGTITCFPPNVERPRIQDVSLKTDPTALAKILVGIIAALGALLFAYHAATGRSVRQEWPTLATRLAIRLEALPRGGKQLLMFCSDAIGLTTALWLAFCIRLETIYIPAQNHLWLFFIAPILAAPIFIRLGLYRAIVRFLGAQALWAVLKAVVLYSIAFTALGLISGIEYVPRSVYLLNGLFAGVLIGLPRLIARDWFGRNHLRAHDKDSARKPVAIYGAGSAGIQLAMALTNSRETKPVAFFDDDSEICGRQIAGIPVYPPSSLPTVIQQHDIADILLAIPSISRQRRQQIIRMLEQQPVRVQTLPGLTDMANGKVQIADLREVEIEDLLGRDPVSPRLDLLERNIAGKVVLVTGAGGSIGAELCRQICRHGATTLVLYENSEFNLYAIEQELLQHPGHPSLIPLLGSVLDQPRLERALHSYGVNTVFHAAAYKHVPMVEKNPAQGVINNIFGTWHAANAALATGVGTFVLISTDKAVRPTNTMGTTKRLAEMILQALTVRHPDSTRFTMVRFGNVLGSSGSVIPLFRQQIKNGGPITVTDPRIIRYFMTIPEAAELVIQAGAMGEGGDVFVLDMSEPVKILDLAQRMVHLSGLQIKDSKQPDGDIEIVFTGLRPGEKLYEELLIGDNVAPTDHPRILRANESTLPWEDIELLLSELRIACGVSDGEKIRELLRRGVHEFEPQCGNQDLLN